MRNYEIVFLFHPNQSDRVTEMLERYKTQIINDYQGEVHRLQDLERKKLHYTIKKCKSSKAHFAVMNITCNQACLTALKDNFKFNDAIMRYLLINRDEVITEQAKPLLEKDEKSSAGRANKQILGTKFKAEDVYLNIGFLRECVLETGRIVPSRVAGLSASQQRQITRAVKLSRFLGLMPYCDRHA